MQDESITDPDEVRQQEEDDFRKMFRNHVTIPFLNGKECSIMSYPMNKDAMVR